LTAEIMVSLPSKYIIPPNKNTSIGGIK